MKTITPRLYLGTMTFGWSQTSSYVDEKIAGEMVDRFIAHNKMFGENAHFVDTARIYAGGKTEKIVGIVLESRKGQGVRLGTKAHPSQPGGLSESGIKAQVQASKEANKVSSFDEFYLHQPDTSHSLLESLQCLDGLVNDGTIKAVGMSNYHASEVERAFALCNEHSLVAPTVYQGLYNPLNRLVEEDLLPLLKQNKCSFVAYNPLAAGLLAGKHTNPESPEKGRFKNNQNYLPRFYTKANFEAVEIIRAACEKEGISLVEATYRWLLRHSALSEADGVLLGASSLSQLDQNLAACAAAKEKGPLSGEIIEAFDKGWELTKNGAFPYWRSYSSDMPNGEELDQGASYEAVKK